MALLTPFRRFARVVPLILAGLLCVLPATPSAAQGYGWFGNLFGGGAPRQTRSTPGYPGYAPRGQADSYYDRPPRRAVRRKPVEQIQRAAPSAQPATEAAKDDASMFVYVLGDNLGELLAGGLDDTLSDRQDVGVVQYTRGSSGLVAADHFDWPKAVQDLLAGRGPPDPKAEVRPASKSPETKDAAPGQKGDAGDKAAGASTDAKAKLKVDVLVIMVGTNDRQPLVLDGKSLKPGTPEWNVAYTKRVMAIDEAARAKNVPLIWVGIPITKDDNFADAMAALNDIYREAAAKTGATYVDTWEAFSDDNGDFSAYGPDINGQTVRLRTSDGIFFTRAGARKLAHFVDTHVRRALEGKMPAPQLPTVMVPQTTTPDKGSDKPVVATRPDAGPIRNLNEPPSTASGTLATLSRASALRSDSGSAPDQVLTGPVPAGRADNAKWSGNVNAEP